eukprot:TRINITY_DN38996_c0_g1_i1.p1 TRINITY_DN38996_c0_g1~~TRINITY_DN38996_c0_g1_i1.p1  ORF type:complete len:286 (-),score=45.93 TRINITY_DN38996_c0_g1_i1:56-913(-)
MVSTICVVGFPSDAPMRERKNYVCFLPGFERSIFTKTSTLFVKFDCQENALTACAVLCQRPYDDDDPSVPSVHAELAKKDMDAHAKQMVISDVPVRILPAPHISVASNGSGGGGGVIASNTGPILPVATYRPPPQPMQGIHVPPPAMAMRSAGMPDNGWLSNFGHSGGMGVSSCRGASVSSPVTVGGGGGGFTTDGGYGAKRARPAQDPMGIFTIAVLGMRAKGLAEEVVVDAMEGLPGYLASKPAHAVDGIFAKFSSPDAAILAMQVLNEGGIHAEMARRNADW